MNSIPTRHIGPRAEYRQQENERVNNSASIAEKFPELRALTADLAYSGAEAGGKNSQIKYRVNIANARSVFRFDCPNTECVGGDFDLSDELTNACAKRQAEVAGECRCEGWRSKATIGTHRCQHILRYRLSLEYEDSLATG